MAFNPEQNQEVRYNRAYLREMDYYDFIMAQKMLEHFSAWIETETNKTTFLDLVL